MLPRLREITGESVQLYRREGTSRVCVAALEPPAGLRDTVPVGTRLPMTAGSGAKVLLAFSDAATQQAVLPTAKFTDRTLAEVRKRGWAQSAAEREPGVASVSAPVRDGRGAVIAAVSVSGPIDRMGRQPGRALGRGPVGRGGGADAPALTRGAHPTIDSALTAHAASHFRDQGCRVDVGNARAGCGTPDGIRTHATAVRGRRPRPLDDGG